jgi:hypothetical protein
MYSKSYKKFYTRAVIITVGLILCSGILSAADIHADSKCHNDCPLCQIRLNNSAPDIYIETCTAVAFPYFSITICTNVVIISKNLDFTAHPPHAPPQS